MSTIETTVLTPELLARLDSEGFIYFLGNSELLSTDDITGICVRIYLIPVKTNPEKDGLPAGYESWFDIKEEGLEMAIGVDSVEFVVNLD